MALAQDEAIAIRVARIARIDSQHVEIGCNENIDTGEAGAQMRGLSLVRVLDDSGADLSRDSLHLVDLWVHVSVSARQPFKPCERIQLVDAGLRRTSVRPTRSTRQCLAQAKPPPSSQTDFAISRN